MELDKLPDIIRELRAELGHSVYDKMPAREFVLSNRLIAVMGELESIALEIESRPR